MAKDTKTEDPKLVLTYLSYDYLRANLQEIRVQQAELMEIRNALEKELTDRNAAIDAILGPEASSRIDLTRRAKIDAGIQAAKSATTTT